MNYSHMISEYRQHPTAAPPQHPTGAPPQTSTWGPGLQSWLQGVSLSLQPAHLGAQGLVLHPQVPQPPGVVSHQNPGIIAYERYYIALKRLQYLNSLPPYMRIKPEVIQEMGQLVSDMAYYQRIMKIYGL